MPSTNQTPNATSTKNPSKKSARTKTWLVLGKLRLGTKRADDILNKQAEFILAHPELYSIHAKAKRLSWEYYDLKFAMHTNDVMIGLGISMRHSQRLLKIAREKLGKSKKDYVSVAEFCRFYKLNERAIRMQIVQKPLPAERVSKHDVERGRWRRSGD